MCGANAGCEALYGLFIPPRQASQDSLPLAQMSTTPRIECQASLKEKSRVWGMSLFCSPACVTQCLRDSGQAQKAPGLESREGSPELLSRRRGLSAGGAPSLSAPNAHTQAWACAQAAGGEWLVHGAPRGGTGRSPTALILGVGGLRRVPQLSGTHGGTRALCQ